MLVAEFIKVSTWLFCRVLGVDLTHFHHHVRRFKATPAAKGRRRSEGDRWPLWLVFSTLVGRRVGDLLNLPGPARISLHRALLDLGAKGFRDALAEGRDCMLIVRGCVCPLLMKRASIEAAAKEDPIGSRHSYIVDLAEIWAGFVPVVEGLMAEEKETRLARATAQATTN